MRKLRKAALVAGASLAMAAGTAAVTATPAMAASTVGGCTTTVRVNEAGFNEASSLCTQGSGSYRALVVLPTFSLGNFPTFYGPVVQVGQVSRVQFGGNTGVAIRVLVARAEILS
jgi:hypothetical protein